MWTKAGWAAVLVTGLLMIGADARPALAQGAAAAAEPRRGPETGLPLPRYVSLKTSEGRARRGPGQTHRIDWLFTHRNMPLRVTAEFENWRRIEDMEGQGGWMHHSLLSGVRTVLIVDEVVTMHTQPQSNAPEVAHLQVGVVARVLRCEPDWCRLGVNGHRGWVERAALWGIEPHEFLD
ncbi:SH3 domain-containing protein [Pararhodobacter sp. SW119]|uniref:SH3 domain-containing protein n=1 Tax=Pararhodobacter sp. SW119 TaxID=2780075 RepID=UPI001FD745EC|nr:SH3 domain-containing protein [Pararhodobacter sp. SW119]